MTAMKIGDQNASNAAPIIGPDTKSRTPLMSFKGCAEAEPFAVLR
jgi:hypothetical protein